MTGGVQCPGAITRCRANNTGRSRHPDAGRIFQRGQKIRATLALPSMATPKMEPPSVTEYTTDLSEIIGMRVNGFR